MSIGAFSNVGERSSVTTARFDVAFSLLNTVSPSLLTLSAWAKFMSLTHQLICRSSSPTGGSAAVTVGQYVSIGSGCSLRSCQVGDESVIEDKCVLMEVGLLPTSHPTPTQCLQHAGCPPPACSLVSLNLSLSLSLSLSLLNASIHTSIFASLSIYLCAFPPPAPSFATLLLGG